MLLIYSPSGNSRCRWVYFFSRTVKKIFSWNCADLMKSMATGSLRVKKRTSGNTKLIPVTPDDILRFYEVKRSVTFRRLTVTPTGNEPKYRHISDPEMNELIRAPVPPTVTELSKQFDWPKTDEPLICACVNQTLKWRGQINFFMVSHRLCKKVRMKTNLFTLYASFYRHVKRSRFTPFLGALII